MDQFSKCTNSQQTGIQSASAQYVQKFVVDSIQQRNGYCSKTSAVSCAKLQDACSKPKGSQSRKIEMLAKWPSIIRTLVTIGILEQLILGSDAQLSITDRRFVKRPLSQKVCDENAFHQFVDRLAVGRAWLLCKEISRDSTIHGTKAVGNHSDFNCSVSFLSVLPGRSQNRRTRRSHMAN